MKTDTLILAAAGAVALTLVLWPKASRAAAALASGPMLGRGDGATVWNPQAQANYRQQLGRELAGAGDFWI
ncbi:hypothetical protein FSC37_09175 [Piscinibacter aquaticus]|uniref:Uncharacterized protein n=1 Tax=Piscinibacter aquaticus TaxID=392597 RepID=A0A5C6U0G0_9BURK|nr:hypothetical protein FSC37_09175 [Piscinibacter aquaticus]